MMKQLTLPNGQAGDGPIFTIGHLCGKLYQKRKWNGFRIHMIIKQSLRKISTYFLSLYHRFWNVLYTTAIIIPICSPVSFTALIRTEPFCFKVITNKKLNVYPIV